MGHETSETLLALDEEARQKRMLIRWCAEGRTDSEIVDLAKDEGWHLTHDRVYKFRKRHRMDIIEYANQHAEELLRRVERAAKPIRVQKVDEVAAKIEVALDELLETDWESVNQKMNAIRIAAKLADTLAKLYRLIAEETHDLTKPAQSVNYYVQILQQAPPEQRAEVVQKLQEIQNLLKAAKSVDALPSGEVVDVEYSEAESEPAGPDADS